MISLMEINEICEGRPDQRQKGLCFQPVPPPPATKAGGTHSPGGGGDGGSIFWKTRETGLPSYSDFSTPLPILLLSPSLFISILSSYCTVTLTVFYFFLKSIETSACLKLDSFKFKKNYFGKSTTRLNKYWAVIY